MPFPPASPEAMVEIQKQAACFLKVYPNWKGPIEPPESVGLMLNILANLKPEDSGKFISHLVRLPLLSFSSV
jgi:hypothetical protein